MSRAHDEKWFAKWEARLEEPLKNTVRYRARSATLKFCTGILALWGLFQILSTWKKVRRVSNLTLEYMNKGRAVTNDGAPGAGKTFTGSNVAYYLALEEWERLKSDYFTERTMVTQWTKEGDSDKLEAFRQLEESYKFFAERESEYIPCLVSSIPLREYGSGRMSYKLTPGMFLQEERVAEYTVFFNDESGDDQGADTSKTTNKDLLAFWRLPRHFFDGKFVNTNQDGSQNAIYMRRSTDFVSHIFGQEWIDRPTLLEMRYNRKERRYFKRLYKGKLSPERAEYIGQKLYFMKKYIQTIGFRKITSQLMTPKGVAIGQPEVTILPAIGGVQYDDRAYRKQYKCKDQPIKMKGWEKLTIEPYDHSDFDKKVKGDGKA